MTSSVSGRAGSIEAAQPGDVQAIVALIRALADYEKLAELCVATEASIGAALFSKTPAAEAIVARTSDGIVGFALFFHTFSTFRSQRGLWLEDLFVLPQHRRMGHGRALLLHLAEIARTRGCGRFEWSVLDWNAAAIRFYECLGAKLLPEWRIVRVLAEDLPRFGKN